MFPISRHAIDRAAPRPVVPRPDTGLGDAGRRPSRMTPAIWPAITLPGHADHRCAVEREALPDLLLALRERAWPLRLGWPTVHGWCEQQLVLAEVQARPGGWLLQWPHGALLLPEAMLDRVWRLGRQRRNGLEQHLLVCDLLGRTTLLLSQATLADAPRCGWQDLLDSVAPWRGRTLPAAQR